MIIFPPTIQTGAVLNVIHFRQRQTQTVRTSAMNGTLERMVSVAVVLPTVTNKPGCVTKMRVYRLSIRSRWQRVRRMAMTRSSPTRASPHTSSSTRPTFSLRERCPIHSTTLTHPSFHERGRSRTACGRCIRSSCPTSGGGRLLCPRLL